MDAMYEQETHLSSIKHAARSEITEGYIKTNHGMVPSRGSCGQRACFRRFSSFRSFFSTRPLAHYDHTFLPESPARACHDVRNHGRRCGACYDQRLHNIGYHLVGGGACRRGKIAAVQYCGTYVTYTTCLAFNVAFVCGALVSVSRPVAGFNVPPSATRRGAVMLRRVDGGN